MASSRGTIGVHAPTGESPPYVPPIYEPPPIVVTDYAPTYYGPPEPVPIDPVSLGGGKHARGTIAVSPLETIPSDQLPELVPYTFLDEPPTPDPIVDWYTPPTTPPVQTNGSADSIPYYVPLGGGKHARGTIAVSTMETIPSDQLPPLVPYTFADIPDEPRLMCRLSIHRFRSRVTPARSARLKILRSALCRMRYQTAINPWVTYQPCLMLSALPLPHLGPQWLGQPHPQG